jgi:hypothetical protein
MTKPAEAVRHRQASAVAGYAIGATVFVAVAASQLFRQTGEASWRTVWAEDGHIFHDGTSSVADLLHPYAGYAQLTGRVIGLVGHLFPIASLARYYAAAGALGTTLAALAVWHFARRLVQPWPLRLVLALSVAFLPTLVLEQTANGVNTLWAALFAGWWALLYQPRTRVDAIPGAAVASFAALSSALALLYVPFAALLAVKRRDAPSRIVFVAFVACAAVQGVVMLSATDATPTFPSHLRDVPRIYTVRVLGSMLVGEQWVGDVWQGMGRAFPILSVLVIATVVVFLTIRCRDPWRCLGLLTIAYSAVMYVVPVWLRGTEQLRIPDGGYFSIGNRYSSLSIWFLLSGIALLTSASRSVTVRRVTTAVIVLQFVVVAVPGYRGTNPRSAGPEWQQTVGAARSKCSERPDSTALLQVIPIGRFPIHVSCSELLD